MKSLAYTLLVLFAALNVAHAASEVTKEEVVEVQEVTPETITGAPSVKTTTTTHQEKQ